MTFPSDYPNSGSTFKLEKPHLIFHPNIDSGSGYICEGSVQDRGGKTRTVKEKVDGFLNLLSFPNEQNAYSGEAVKLFNKDRYDYHREAKRRFR